MNNEIESLRIVLVSYFNTVIFHCQEYIPKLIMNILQKYCSTTVMQNKLYQNMIEKKKLFYINEKLMIEKTKILHKKKCIEESLVLLNEYN